MTDENRAAAIAEELERSRSSLAAAKLLLREGYVNDSVSRLYYYLLYHVRALLLTRGIEAKSHEGALRLYALHFIKNGPLPTSASHLFSRLMKYREEADYNPSYTFEKSEVEAWMSECEELGARIQDLIDQQGYLEAT